MTKNNKIIPAVLLASLGYFVDIYDLILFSIVRVKSLKSLGVIDADLLSNGILLLNMQMAGMLLGGFLWGILGDKKGRLSVLLGSIFLYSLANIANGFVHDIPMYALLRFIAGIGLAGELGAGITLVSETMPIKTRGYGTTIVSVVGILGAVAAAFIADLFDWRTAYFIGGGMGIVLLLLRIQALESGLFQKALKGTSKRGDLRLIFCQWRNFFKYLRCVIIGIPLWFVVGVLVTFSPEFGKALGMKILPDAGKAVMFTYIGLSCGGLISGIWSQMIQSRIRVVAVFMALNACLMAAYLFSKEASLGLMYGLCFLLGVASGYWALFVTIAAEQFGTNVRSTVTTTVPNVVRGSVVLLTIGFQSFKGLYGTVPAGMIVGGVCVLLAFWALSGLEETYSKDLDYVE